MLGWEMIVSTAILFHWLMTRASRDVHAVDASANDATVVTRKAAETTAVMADRFLRPCTGRDRPQGRMVALPRRARSPANCRPGPAIGRLFPSRVPSPQTLGQLDRRHGLPHLVVAGQ